MDIDDHIIGRDKSEYNSISKLRKFLYDLTLDHEELINYIKKTSATHT